MFRASRQIVAAVSLVAWASYVAGAAGQSGRAKFTCEISENGDPASGTFSLQRGGQEVAAGACGKELSVEAGAYTAIVRLDGALDGPSQQQAISIEANSRNSKKFDFQTGTLEIRIASQGKRAAGMAIIKRNGAQIGTLGSGVAAHLSAGTYRVVARYRTQEKDLGTVEIKAGQRVTLDAAFD